MRSRNSPCFTGPNYFPSLSVIFHSSNSPIKISCAANRPMSHDCFLPRISCPLPTILLLRHVLQTPRPRVMSSCVPYISTGTGHDQRYITRSPQGEGKCCVAQDPRFTLIATCRSAQSLSSTQLFERLKRVISIGLSAAKENRTEASRSVTCNEQERRGRKFWRTQHKTTTSTEK